MPKATSAQILHQLDRMGAEHLDGGDFTKGLVEVLVNRLSPKDRSYMLWWLKSQDRDLPDFGWVRWGYKP